MEIASRHLHVEKDQDEDHREKKFQVAQSHELLIITVREKYTKFAILFFYGFHSRIVSLSFFSLIQSNV